MLFLLKRLTKSQMSLFDPPKHEEERTIHAGVRHMASGAIVNVQEHQRRTKVSDKPQHGFNFETGKFATNQDVYFKMDDWDRARKGRIMWQNRDGSWKIKGQPTDKDHPEGKNKYWQPVHDVPEHQIKSTEEQQAQYAPTGKYENGQIKAEILNERAKVGYGRLGRSEYETLTHPVITGGLLRLSRGLAAKNGLNPGYRTEHGLVMNDDFDAQELHDHIQTTVMASLRRQLASAPDEIVEEFKDHLDGKKQYSRIYHTALNGSESAKSDGKTAGIRYLQKRGLMLNTSQEYNTSQEDDFESGMQGISREIEEKISDERGMTGKDKTELEEGISEQLKMLDDPIAEAIIKMRYGFDGFTHDYAEKDIAAALNRQLKTDTWTKEKIQERLKLALLRLGKTRGMKDMKGLLKSIQDAVEDSLLKSHIKEYTKMDGTVVQEHDDKRVKKHQDLIGHQNNHGEEIHSGAKLEHGGKLVEHLRNEGWKEKQVHQITSKNGAVGGKKEDAPEPPDKVGKIVEQSDPAVQRAKKTMQKMRETVMSSDDPIGYLKAIHTHKDNTSGKAIHEYRQALLQHFGHDIDENKSATRFEKDGHIIVISKDGDKHTVHYAGADTSKDKNKPIGKLAGKKEVESVDTGKKEPKFVFGEDDLSYTSKNNEVHSKFALVEADDLTTSHTIQGHINKAYPQEIQPRERERLSSQMQMANIMNDIKPALMTNTGMAAHGTPIVGKDGAVESGNGRTIALIEAYKRDKANHYKEHLVKHAEKYGLNPEDAEKMKNPVLVRVRNDDDPNTDRAEFAKEANDTGNLGSSPAEQAWSDADRIDPALLKKFTVDEDGEIYNDDNMDFINGFLDKLGKNEAASLRDADGDPNKKCIERIQNAVFAKVYGSSTLVELQAESAKPKIRNVLKALNSCVGDFAQVKEHDDLDVVPDMMEALEYYLAHKDESKAEMEHTLKNAGSLNFTGDAPTFKTDHAVNMILAIADRAGSRNRLENVFRSISNEIKNEVAQRENPEVDMFSGPYQPKSKEQVVKQALDKVGREEVSKSLKPGLYLLRKSGLYHHHHNKEYIYTTASGKAVRVPAMGAAVVQQDAAHEAIKEWRHGGKNKESGSPIWDHETFAAEDHVIAHIPIHRINIETVEDSVNRQRVDRYKQRRIHTPIYGRFSENTATRSGKIYPSDGGHRLMAAHESGDKAIAVIMPRSEYARYKEHTIPEEVAAFREDILDAKAHKYADHQDIQVMAHTPEVYTYLGATDLPITTKAKTVRKLIAQWHNDGHELPIDDAKRIPEIIQEPAMVFDPDPEPEKGKPRHHSAQNSLVILTELRTKTKQQRLFVILQMSKNIGRENTVNYISSSYDRPDADIKKWIEGGLLRYYDNKKGSAWLREIPLSMQVSGTSYPNRFGHSIIFKSQKVNKSLRSVLWLRKLPHSLGQGSASVIAPISKNRTHITHDPELSPKGVNLCTRFDKPIQHFGISSHNTLQKSNLPYEGI